MLWWAHLPITPRFSSRNTRLSCFAGLCNGRENFLQKKSPHAAGRLVFVLKFVYLSSCLTCLHILSPLHLTKATNRHTQLQLVVVVVEHYVPRYIMERRNIGFVSITLAHMLCSTVRTVCLLYCVRVSHALTHTLSSQLLLSLLHIHIRRYVLFGPISPDLSSFVYFTQSLSLLSLTRTHSLSPTPHTRATHLSLFALSLSLSLTLFMCMCKRESKS